MKYKIEKFKKKPTDSDGKQIPIKNVTLQESYMVLPNFQNRSTYLNHRTENKMHIIFYLYTTTAQFLRKIWRHKWYHGESRKCTNGKNFIEVLMIPYQMTPNLTKAELISAMDSINHSNALFGHSNENSLKTKMEFSCFFSTERY